MLRAEIIFDGSAFRTSLKTATGSIIGFFCNTFMETYRISGEYLGRGLSILIDVLNPERIVIGSVYARCTDLLEPYSSQIVQREALKNAAAVCKVIPAELGESIGDYAALSVAANLLK